MSAIDGGKAVRYRALGYAHGRAPEQTREQLPPFRRPKVLILPLVPIVSVVTVILILGIIDSENSRPLPQLFHCQCSSVEFASTGSDTYKSSRPSKVLRNLARGFLNYLGELGDSQG